MSSRKLSWEWEYKKDNWVKYAPEINNKINDSLENGKTDVIVTVEKSNLQIKVTELIQKNQTTGFERKIRCTIKSENGENCAWQWNENDDKSSKAWHYYLPGPLADLERAFQEKSGSSLVSLKLGEDGYTADLEKMEQKNDDSGVSQKIRRIVTSCEHSSSAAPAPPGREVSINHVIKIGPKKDKNDEGEDTKPPPEKKSKGKATTAKSGEREKSGPAPTAEPPTKKVVVKGKAAVDPECTYKLGKAHVYFEGSDIYDVMLNQTNLQNNNNKYYVIQLLKDDNAKSYSVWQRWGRVGFKGQHNLVPCGPDLDQAKRVFCQKFSDKTKNDWADRKKFKKVAGKYDLIKVDYSAENGKESEKANSSTCASAADTGDAGIKVKEEEKPPTLESKLDKRIQTLLNLICDIKAMAETVMELEYDTNKLPLGKLTAAQIKAGYTALKKIEGCIERKDFGTKLMDACNEYYTRIPHCFGMRRPPMIKDEQALKKELQLVEALGDIEVAIRVLKQGDEDKKSKEDRLHPVDRHYKAMECDLKPLEKDSSEFEMVEKCLLNTQGPTHTMYKMKVKNIFDCAKHGEKNSFKDVGNKMLLWHGSRLTNWYGILSQGLKIAPPEAPMTGYMFGKGLYFADVSSKSSNYCFATPQKNTGLVLLCEVSLGKANDLIVADYKADKLPPGCNSTRGLGMWAPDPKDNLELEDGCIVAQGKPIHTGVENKHGYTLNYNEFVVYDNKQVKMKYLVEVEFQF